MNENNIYIFGAHSRAQTLAVYLKYLQPDINILAFLYDNDEKNPKRVDGMPVLKLSDGLELHKDCTVYIGTRGIYHNDITENLRGLGFSDIRPVTVEFDLDIRNRYLHKYYDSIGREFDKMNDFGPKSAKVYVANSINDKPLLEPFELKPYEEAIQVGSAMTVDRLYEGVVTDDTGDNISRLNRQFCELTAMYWIWKNATEDIEGLVHYRRHFILPDDWVERMYCNNVDVILPTPLYVAPSIAGNFNKRHDPSNWGYLMECWEHEDYEECQEAKLFFDGNLYSPCNMFIMRREVLNDLCQWMFPKLFAVAGHGGINEDAYQNRYPGFISERLITFFFDRHRDKYKVVYADKNFLP
jgi:hypothetical protein